MLRQIMSLFSSTKQDPVPDLIDVLDLKEWYTNLTEEERQKLHEYSTVFGLDGERNSLDQSIRATSQTQQGYLKGVGSQAVTAKDYAFAEQVLLRALEAEDDNPTDRHFVYNSLIDLYYKQRDERNDAINNCIAYCKEDIEMIDEFIGAWKREHNTENLPKIPSFKRLTIIYKKQGNYQDALSVCDQALAHGLDDGTKGGFEGRKERLQEKMN